MIECVEEFCAELQGQSFPKLKHFADRKILVGEPRAKYLITTQIAEITSGLFESQSIQVAGAWRPIRKYRVHARNDIRTLQKVEIHSAVRGENADRSPRLYCNHGVELPTVANELWQPLDHRHLIVDRGGPAVARVVCGRTLFRAKICRVLRECRVGEIKVNPVRGSVKRLGPRVGGKSCEPVPALQAHRAL